MTSKTPHRLVTIDPSQGVWLTGDLTNHNTESAILSVKQTRQESKLTSGGLELEKWCVLMSFCSWNKIISDVHSCLFRVLSKYEKMIVHVSPELRHYTNLSRHITKPQNSICCFLKNDQIWKLRLCFIPKVTCSVLSVSMLSVFSFSLRKNTHYEQ